MTERKYVVHAVHGTWAESAAWVAKDSVFFSTFARKLGGSVIVKPFPWSGRNTHAARLHAASDLANRLREDISDEPDAFHILVAHSHGGNIALYAMRDLWVAARVRAVVTLATPFVWCEPRANKERLQAGMGCAAFMFGVAILGSIAEHLASSASDLAAYEAGAAFGAVLLAWAAYRWSSRFAAGALTWADLAADGRSIACHVQVAAHGDEARFVLGALRVFRLAPAIAGLALFWAYLGDLASTTRPVEFAKGVVMLPVMILVCWGVFLAIEAVVLGFTRRLGFGEGLAEAVCLDVMVRQYPQFRTPNLFSLELMSHSVRISTPSTQAVVEQELSMSRTLSAIIAIFGTLRGLVLRHSLVYRNTSLIEIIGVMTKLGIDKMVELQERRSAQPPT